MEDISKFEDQVENIRKVSKRYLLKNYLSGNDDVQNWHVFLITTKLGLLNELESVPIHPNTKSVIDFLSEQESFRHWILIFYSDRDTYMVELTGTTIGELVSVDLYANFSFETIYNEKYCRELDGLKNLSSNQLLKRLKKQEDVLSPRIYEIGKVDCQLFVRTVLRNLGIRSYVAPGSQLVLAFGRVTSGSLAGISGALSGN